MLKRALAVKMSLESYKHWHRKEILGGASGFIHKWKQAFIEKNIAGLKLKYEGNQGYLEPAQRQAVTAWLKTSIALELRGT